MFGSCQFGTTLADARPKLSTNTRRRLGARCVLVNWSASLHRQRGGRRANHSGICCLTVEGLVVIIACLQARAHSRRRLPVLGEEMCGSAWTDHHHGQLPYVNVFGMEPAHTAAVPYLRITLTLTQARN